MNTNYDELKRDFKKLCEVAWDCRCGAGWYDIEQSSDKLWRLLIKYGYHEDERFPTKYSFFRKKRNDT